MYLHPFLLYIDCYIGVKIQSVLHHYHISCRNTPTFKSFEEKVETLKVKKLWSENCMWVENAENLISDFTDQDYAIDGRYWRGFRIHTRRRTIGWTARWNMSTRSNNPLRIHPQKLPSSFSSWPPVPLLPFHGGTSTVTVSFVLWS